MYCEYILTFLNLIVHGIGSRKYIVYYFLCQWLIRCTSLHRCSHSYSFFLRFFWFLSVRRGQYYHWIVPFSPHLIWLWRARHICVEAVSDIQFNISCSGFQVNQYIRYSSLFIPDDRDPVESCTFAIDHIFLVSIDLLHILDSLMNRIGERFVTEIFEILVYPQFYRFYFFDKLIPCCWSRLVTNMQSIPCIVFNGWQWIQKVWWSIGWFPSSHRIQLFHPLYLNSENKSKMNTRFG